MPHLPQPTIPGDFISCVLLFRLDLFVCPFVISTIPHDAMVGLIRGRILVTALLEALFWRTRVERMRSDRSKEVVRIQGFLFSEGRWID